MIKYDKTNKNSIYDYSKKLIGMSFNDIALEFERNKNLPGNMKIKESTEASVYGNWSKKGGLGELVEEKFFYYKPDNESRADFPEARLELKVTPYKKNKNKSISAKERVSISMINYSEIINTNFYQSNAWEKIENILFIYYLWKDLENRLDYIIDYVYLYSPTEQDLRVIIKDFQKIKNKVIDGKAHEISEGDTLYLGASTKSSNSRVRVSQPNSSIPAKPRAFSFKNSYMTHLLRSRIHPASIKYDSIIKDDITDDLELYVSDKIEKYKGLSETYLVNSLLDGNFKSKNRFTRIAYEILNIKTKNAIEFEKANIEVKSIRVNSNNKIVESMSFPTFKVMDLVKKEWEDSDVYTRFSETKYLFVIYKEVNNEYYLKGSLFWNMPVSDIEGDLKLEWLRAQKTFKDGVQLKPGINKAGSYVTNNLPKLSNTNIMHVRNHSAKSVYLIKGKIYGKGKLSRDSDILPNGDRISKQCFWLNNKYVLKQIKHIIQKT